MDALVETLPDPGHPGPLVRRDVEGRGFVQEPVDDVVSSPFEGQLGRPQKPPGTPRRVDGQPRRAFQCRLRRGHAAPALGPRGGSLQFGGHTVVRTGTRGRPMPDPAVDIAERLRQGRVRTLLLGRARPLADGVPNERMPESHLRRVRLDELHLDGRREGLQRDDVAAEHRGRRQGLTQCAPVVQGGDEQQSAGRVRQRRDTSRECVLQPVGERQPGDLVPGDRKGQLHEGERITSRLGQQAVSCSRTESRRTQRQQFLGGTSCEPLEATLDHLRAIENAREAVALSGHQHHGLGLQPPGDEAEHLSTGPIEPMHVIDGQQHRLLGGAVVDEGQRRQPDQEKLRSSRCVRHAERPLEGVTLRRRE